MQDLDWELPSPVELTFYATRNLLDKVNGEEVTVFDEPQIYVVINQAIDALSQEKIMSDVEIKELLKKYKNGTLLLRNVSKKRSVWDVAGLGANNILKTKRNVPNWLKRKGRHG